MHRTRTGRLGARGRAARPRGHAPAAVVVTALLALLLLPAGASAHPSLVQGSPAAGGLVDRAPRAIALLFNEALAGRGERLEVRALDRATPAPRVGAVRREGRAKLSAPVSGLRRAVYEVRWTALGADGHAVGGTFRFGVSSPDGTPPPGAERLGAAGASGSGTPSGEGPGPVVARWSALLAAALLLGGALLRWRLGTLGRADARWARAVLLALVVGTLGAAGGVVAAAGAGEDGALGQALDTATGRLALVALGLWLVGGLVALRLGVTRPDGDPAPAAKGSPDGASSVAAGSPDGGSSAAAGSPDGGSSAAAGSPDGGSSATVPSAAIRGRRAGEVVVAAATAGTLVAAGFDGHLQAVEDDRALAAIGAVVHVLAAGVWSGALLALVVLRPSGRRAALRAFAPLAMAAVGALALTGVLAALREVDHTVFLQHTGYGRVVVLKAVLLVALAALGAWAVLRTAEPGRRLLRADAAGAAGLLLAAAALAGLVQGRGQLLPAQRGVLLGGPATATAATGEGLLRLTVAPARAGENVVVARPDALQAGGDVPVPTSVRVRLRNGDTEVAADLRRDASGTWRGTADLPDDGTWFAYADADAQRAAAPVALAIGDADAFGPEAEEVVQTADLSGASAVRCRAEAQGLALALGRFNAQGGLPGGTKALLRTEDDGGDPERAAELVAAARERGAVAVAAPCGAGAGGALRAAGDLPVVVADPQAPVVRGERVFRLAPEPAAEGRALGRYIASQVAGVRPDLPRRVTTFAAATADGRARQGALREALEAEGLQLRVLAADVRDDPRALARAIGVRDGVAAVLEGGDATTWARAIDRAAQAGGRGLVATSIFAPGPLYGEELVLGAGSVGRAGAIRAPSEVLVGSRDGAAYANAVRGLFRGDLAAVSGLRGFVAGLALGEGLADGPDAGDVAARLERPRRFTDALTVPYRAGRTWAGVPQVGFVTSSFLPSGLRPTQTGGERFQGSYFPDGTWQPITTTLFGRDLPGLPSS